MNTEELKALIPDYINGVLNEPDRIRVEKALRESEELRQFHREISSVFDILGKMEFLEPDPQYWNNLLPKIHRKIDLREAKKPARLVWKYLVPVAAVILIFILYMIFNTPESQMTKDDKKIEDIEKEDKLEKKSTDEIKKDAATNDARVKVRKKTVVRDKKQEDLELNIEEENIVVYEKQDDIILQDEPLPIDAESMSLFASGDPGGVDEEVADELEKLAPGEKDLLIGEIENIEL